MIKLNEKNIQSNFCYNPNTGTYETRLVKNNINLSSKNKYIKIHDDKATVDLGYSIDNIKENLPIIKINDNALIVMMLDYETDLLGRNIKSNEAIIITSSAELCTSIFVNSENIADDKNMYYEIESLNTSLPSWMLDDISKNINNNIPTLEKNVATNKNDINILSSRIDDNDNDISNLDGRIVSNDSDIENINVNISNLDERIVSNDSDIENINTNISNLDERIVSNDSDIENININISRHHERILSNNNNIENLNNIKQSNLSPGSNITIENNIISATSTDASLTGMMMAFAGDVENIPSNAFLADGREISRITYARLFAKIGTLWGDGDGSTTFNIPDGRGSVLKGAGQSSGYQHNEDRGAVGSKQNTAIRNITGGVSYGPSFPSYFKGAFYPTGVPSSNSSGDIEGMSLNGRWAEFDSSRVVQTGTTNRDNNIAVNHVIFA